MTAAVVTRRYKAFISYSHADADAARWLHRRLEGFVMPKRLVGRPGTRGPISPRLVPIFKDREDLPAAHDLTGEVRAALDASDCLIVLATPAAAAIVRNMARTKNGAMASPMLVAPLAARAR